MKDSVEVVLDVKAGIFTRTCGWFCSGEELNLMFPLAQTSTLWPPQLDGIELALIHLYFLGSEIHLQQMMNA